MKKTYLKIRDYIFRKFPELYIRLHLLRMRLQGADKYQRWLEKGDFYLNRGTRVQIGQPVKFRLGKYRKTKYIKGLYYDFGKRKVTALYSDKPIKGLSEKFIKQAKSQ